MLWRNLWYHAAIAEYDETEKLFFFFARPRKTTVGPTKKRLPVREIIKNKKSSRSKKIYSKKELIRYYWVSVGEKWPPYVKMLRSFKPVENSGWGWVTPHSKVCFLRFAWFRCYWSSCSKIMIITIKKKKKSAFILSQQR